MEFLTRGNQNGYHLNEKKNKKNKKIKKIIVMVLVYVIDYVNKN